MGGAAPPASESPAPADADVVQRAREGDHAAFGVLVKRYQGRAYRLALRVLREDEEARDVVQDAFLKAYGSLDRFEGRSSFYTWLHRIVMNLCLDRKRRDRSDREVEWNEEIGGGSVGDPAAPGGAGQDPARSGPEAEVERSELRVLLARAIQTLPEDARRTIQLREIDGLSYREIAEVLGIPRGTVMSRLHYARRRLQESLREAGVDPLAEGASAENRA